MKWSMIPVSLCIVQTPEIVTKVYAIVGFLKLIDSYYVWVVTKGHKVRSVI